MPRGNEDARARVELAEQLRARRGAIEEGVLIRTYAIADPGEAADPEYAAGLRAAVSAALDYGIDALEQAGDHARPVPTVLLGQARLAARHKVSLDTVLRRYFAGYTLLGDFVIEEGEGKGLVGASLKRLLQVQAAHFDRLLAAVTEAYNQEAARPGSPEERRVERIQRLLTGELLDASGLDYEFNGFHVGLATTGPGVEQVLRRLASSLDRSLLLVRPDERTAWAWLAGRKAPDPAVMQARLAAVWPSDAVLAVGEPAEGLEGWRLSHRQAIAALPVALQGGESVVRYGDVAMLASAVRDDLLNTSLRRMYLLPLQLERDGGEVVKQALRAYFAAARNVSAAAAALRVSRSTVTSRLHAAEDLLGRSLDEAAPDLETALRLDELSSRASSLAPH